MRDLPKVSELSTKKDDPDIAKEIANPRCIALKTELAYDPTNAKNVIKLPKVWITHKLKVMNLSRGTTLGITP